MTPSQIEASVLEALDAGDEPTLELYAEFAAGHIDMVALSEALCLAVIKCGGVEWQRLMSVCYGNYPALGVALDKIERHIDAQRQPFAAARASGIDDMNEHDKHLLADLERELNGVNHE